MSKNKSDSKRCAICKGRIRKVNDDEYSYECLPSGMYLTEAKIEHKNPVIKEGSK